MQKPSMAYLDSRERWLKHYSSFHQMLLVGEGDFSFSLSLARSFGNASNIVATSFDSYDALIMKYAKAKQNLQELRTRGASLLHGLDATQMKVRPFIHRRFDRIIFNFPHAGFYGKENNPHMIEMHQNLVFGFFHNASAMLTDCGEVHVSHRTSPPYSLWNLKELASKASLVLIGLADFKVEDYPGYEHKRGNGRRSDESFTLGECCTFKFVFSSSAVSHVFEWYLDIVKKTNGQLGKSAAHITHLGITHGYEQYVSRYGAGYPAGFTDLLIELHRLTHGKFFRLEDLLVRESGQYNLTGAYFGC